jgi:hypothetical protein
MFCVQQLTKSRKWACRVCSTKQSIVKVYFRAYKASDVRPIVQQLSMARGRLETEIPAAPCNAAERPLSVDKAAIGASWAGYVDEPEPGAGPHEDDSRYTTSALSAVPQPPKRVGQQQISGFKRKSATFDRSDTGTVLPSTNSPGSEGGQADKSRGNRTTYECKTHGVERAMPIPPRGLPLVTLQTSVHAQLDARVCDEGDEELYVTNIPSSSEGTGQAPKRALPAAPAKASIWDEYL